MVFNPASVLKERRVGLIVITVQYTYKVLPSLVQLLFQLRTHYFSSIYR